MRQKEFDTEQLKRDEFLCEQFMATHRIPTFRNGLVPFKIQVQRSRLKEGDTLVEKNWKRMCDYLSGLTHYSDLFDNYVDLPESYKQDIEEYAVKQNSKYHTDYDSVLKTIATLKEESFDYFKVTLPTGEERHFIRSGWDGSIIKPA